jgi:hypothetical protein
VKDYVKFQLVAGRAAPTLNEAAYYLGLFFTFFLKRYPDADTLYDLTTQDIDAFIIALRAKRNKGAAKTSDRQIVDYLLRVEGLLHYLERCQSPIKPHKPVATIVWPHHYPRCFPSSSRQVKYIPETVLSQLEASLEHLLSIYIPVVIVLRASGWRISAVLSETRTLFGIPGRSILARWGYSENARVQPQNSHHARDGYCRSGSYQLALRVVQ